MKSINMKTILIFIAIVATSIANAQTINWASVKPEHKHVIHANVGWDYAAAYGVGYSYVMHTKFQQALTAQFSAPTGNNLWDDLKVEGTYQMRLVNLKNFNVITSATANFRRFESSYLRTNSFGSKFTAVAGYYRLSWFVAGELGFDKAIATHIANGKQYLENFPDAVDGWYVPTGGNWNFGIQGGFSLKNIDITLKTGVLKDQSGNANPIVPYYFQLGVNRRF